MLVICLFCLLLVFRPLPRTTRYCILIDSPATVKFHRLPDSTLPDCHSPRAAFPLAAREVPARAQAR